MIKCASAMERRDFVGKLVTTLALAALLLGAALYTFGGQIMPSAGEAGRATAEQIRNAF